MTRRLLLLVVLGITGFIASGRANAQFIYWIETDTSDDSGFIYAAPVDGSGAIQLVTLPAGTKADGGLAIDPAAGKMYWTEELLGRIRRADLNGQNQETVLSFLSYPWGLALDLTNNFIYWTQSGNNGNTHIGIFRAGLDGSNPEELLNVDAFALALDVPSGKMYYSVILGQAPPRSANLDGSGSAAMMHPLDWGALFSINFPFALAVDSVNEKLFLMAGGIATPSLYLASGRVDFDGMNLEKLVTRGPTPPFPIGLLPFGLALDPANNLMYWNNSDTPSRIYRSNLDGGNVTHIYEKDDSRAILALALGPAPPLPDGIPAASTWGSEALVLCMMVAATRLLRMRNMSTAQL